jgi:hypothetical protein
MESQLKKKHFNRQKLQFSQYKKWGGNVCQSKNRELTPKMVMWTSKKIGLLTNKRMWITLW